MARKPRVLLPGGVYHVILRGNGGQPIFSTGADHSRLEELLAEGVRRFRYRVHAYCWMPNHIHLLIQVGPIGLPKILQNLAFRYARWVNRRQRRRGHLFQGRYQAILVDADRYLLELVRYIHLNPVRAGVVERPSAYPHSSHRAYLGQTTVPWLHADWVLGQFGETVTTAQRRYRRFVEEGLAEGHRADLYRGSADRRMLGDDRFVASVERQTKKILRRPLPLERIVATTSSVLGMDPERLCSASRERELAQARAVVAYVVTEHGQGTLTALGSILHRDIATLSNGARATRERLVEDRALRDRVERVVSALRLQIKR
jgi:REP element-mobilizing transposase RayT